MKQILDLKYLCAFGSLLVYLLPVNAANEAVSGIDGSTGFLIPVLDEDASDETPPSGFKLEAENDVDSTQEDASEEAGVFQVLPEFTVTAKQDRGYYSANSLAGTRTNELIKNTPMTISVVNQEMLEDLSLYGIDDLTNAIASAEAEDESFSNKVVRFRGFRTASQLYEFMPRQLAQDSYNVERADVVRGANSLVYGQSAPSGKINFLAKQASFGKNKTTLETSVSDENLIRGSFDTNYVVNDQLAVRVMGVHTEQEYEQNNTRYSSYNG